MKTRSLTRVLTVGVLTANLVCLISFSIVATLHEMHGRRRAFDVMLRGRADSLLGAINNTTISGDPITLDAAEIAAQGGDLYEVVSSGGSVIAASSNITPALTAQLDRSPQQDYFDFDWNSIQFRAFRLQHRVAANSQTATVTVIYAASTEDLKHEAVEAAYFYTKAGAGLLLVMAISLVLFLRFRLMPLKELAVRAGRVSVDSWDFDPPKGALRTAELRPIATSISKLLQGLRAAFERQRQFTGDAAHELKTSIAVLKSSLQLLSMKQRSAPEYEKGIAELGVDIRRTEDLTEQMLTLARLEGEGIQSNQTIDMSQTVRFVMDRLQAVALIREIELCTRTDEASNVRMQSKDAEVLCSNLIMNALQYSSSHSKVVASVRSIGGRTELRVADRGEGIAATSLPHIFERFYRADSSRSRRSGGTGLGLAICKAIVDRSGGSIRIESKLGGGTEVIVILPSEV
jgi:signal transduction histidine kinase